MIHFLTKVLYIPKGNHQSLLKIVCLFILISGLEVVETGMIAPFTTMAITPDTIKNIYWLNLIYNQINFDSEQQFLIFLGLVGVIAFYLKSCLAFNVQKTVFKFSYALKKNYLVSC